MSEADEINIEELMKNINEQIWSFEHKYHKKPKFLKVGIYVYYELRRMTNTNVRFLETVEGNVIPFMGLLVCDTPAIEDFSVEVF